MNEEQGAQNEVTTQVQQSMHSEGANNNATTETPSLIQPRSNLHLIATLSAASAVIVVSGIYIYKELAFVRTYNAPPEDVVYPISDEPVASVPDETTPTLNASSSATDLILAQIPENSHVLFDVDSNKLKYIDDSEGYKNYKDLDLDWGSFVYINEDYVKDADTLYYRGDEVYGFDPTNCSVGNIEGCRHDSWKATFSPYELDVSWSTELTSASELIPRGYCVSEGYQAGLVKNGPLTNGVVYIRAGEVCDMWCGGFYERKGYHYVSYNNQLIPVQDEGFTISGIDDFPDSVSVPGSDLHLLTLGPAGLAGDRDTHARFLFSDPQAGNIFDSGRGNYHSVRGDHIRMEYELEFPFWSDEEKDILSITFDDQTVNEEAYRINGGYGEGFYIEDDPGLENRLVRAGQFTEQHPVYRLVNTNDHLMRELYENKNTMASFQNGANKYTYDEFISHHPLLYWKNPFGDWVTLLNRRYETAAEKCKPVIYLYPEEVGDFEVKVEPNGGFTSTIPEYGDGWKVAATPDSQITDKRTGEVYPYLYWEGVNTGIPEITQGWVVNVRDVERFLKEKLAILGLNDKEITDFNEYWVDRLQDEGSEQYKIMFVPKAHFDVLSPLTVTGDEQPSSIIRVMMYAQPARADEVLPERSLPETPKREGFTVVEWGGALFN